MKNTSNKYSLSYKTTRTTRNAIFQTLKINLERFDSLRNLINQIDNTFFLMYSMCSVLIIKEFKMIACSSFCPQGNIDR